MRVTPPPFSVPTWIVTNSPMRLCEPIVERGVRAVLVRQVLRRAADRGAVLNVVVGADRDAPIAAADPDVRLDHGSRADLDLALEHAVRTDLDVGRDLRAARSTMTVGWMLNA